MASLLIAAGALTYDKIQTHRAQKIQKKEHNKARFAELQQENAKRVARLSSSISDPSNNSDHHRDYSSTGQAPRDPPAYSNLDDNDDDESRLSGVDDGGVGGRCGEGKSRKERQKQKKGFKKLLKREKEGMNKPVAKEYNVMR
ncbi:MAG: hypothetical protein M1835_000155 [Candelina submexicana]|nr:MAG: hypothetical protein M1835_000155 [Candelina submexicana]